MKYLNIVLRVLLGLPFIVFGVNKFAGFLEMPPLEGPALEFMMLLFNSGFLDVVGALEVIAGILIISGFFVPLGLVIIFPINLNIILYHVLFTGGAGIELGALLTIINIVLFFRYKPSFAGLLESKPSQAA